MTRREHLVRKQGRKLKRLPSDVYWAGLGDWGIRRFSGSINDYFGSLDRIYALRKQAHAHGEDATEDSNVLTWHPHLPDPPENFPWGIELFADPARI